MILGTKARYAVMAMVELAKREAGRPVTLADLAESQEITVPYLEQIFSKLKHCNIVKSVRGPGGGYILAHPADKILISDIVSAVEEAIAITRCEKHSGHGCMSGGAKCATHDLWEGLGNQIQQYLGSISLHDVLNHNLPGKKPLDLNMQTNY